MCDKFSKKSRHIFDRLFEVIEHRRTELPPDSYTSSLFRGGIEMIAAKLSEETEELIESANASFQSGHGETAKKQMIHEAADLMYHFLILLAARDVTLYEVERELEKRFGISGLTEKATRER